MADLASDSRLDFVSADDMAFATAFTDSMERLGYESGELTDGICFGKYMLIFRKANVKSRNVYARIYFRESGAVLRLFLNNVTKHGDFIAAAPDFIRAPFTGAYANCSFCRGDSCKFRKSYDIAGEHFDKCNGLTFEFTSPTPDRLPAYLALFTEFYPAHKRA